MKIAVVGLGYVGLPLALELARHYPGTIGFDINTEKVTELSRGIDRTGELDPGMLVGSPLRMTANPEEMLGANFFIVAVPTPIDKWNRPDLTPLIKSSETVGKVLGKGAIVVYESTVFPGATEEICGPILERFSGLRAGKDFKLGYSPERINPGDKLHSVTSIVKVVSGQDAESLAAISNVYGTVISAGVHQAPSIKVAEAAKVFENTQRDINIALVNELAIICEKLNLRTADVLTAARTKWNFLPFSPGLVGGHCIGVDPYYLTTKAEELGYHPQVILAGRRINDSMGAFVGQKLVKLLIERQIPVKGAKVGILGITFKEDVSDIRNSKVPDIVAELRQFGIEPLLYDPLADPEAIHEEYGLTLSPWERFEKLDALVVAVSHRSLLDRGVEALTEGLREGGVLVDLKSCLQPSAIRPGLTYWSL